MTANHTTVVSAPGKVLLAGGYLVLDQAYHGLVVGTTSRFYTVIQPGKENTIHVKSPQFESDATWTWTASVNNGNLEFAAKDAVSAGNKFVETCLRFSLQVIQQRMGTAVLNEYLQQGFEITIVGDNDFYSQRAQLSKRQLPNTAEALASLEPFCNTHSTLGSVHKTGLGSSAALTTSLVGALFTHMGAASLSNADDKILIHNVAQFIHCFAQGKVGSGFDVSAAVFGNHRYTRFNPSFLSSIMKDNVDPSELNKALDPSITSWDNVVTPFQLPPKFELMLGDVDAGSHTPSLVGKVLAWRKSKPEEANALWNELGGMNAKVEEHLRELSTMASTDSAAYHTALEKCAKTKASEWDKIMDESPVIQKMKQLATDFLKVRAHLQEMGSLSDVPIEPKEQTRLLDACMDIEGVVMAGVPGAGGYDAIFCIVISQDAKAQVHSLWQSWKELNVGPLLAQADDKGMEAVALESVDGLARLL
ncbi:hypothetical protein LRAMOSA11199 [Lichtheimia ramosa]|uniref:Phosphomevalonate kinase n=1 Tax=Lichtheimia ramosa TaxID=688394 RepID=A0A077WUK1_9FUNG|nr:hypothetical protein LRAMOSA11199 [Lichtheimia ramosa]